jgi:hypothetical protein
VSDPRDRGPGPTGDAADRAAAGSEISAPSAALVELAAAVLASGPGRAEQTTDTLPSERLPFRASVGTPALHQWAGQALAPARPGPPPDDPWAISPDDDLDVLCQRYFAAARAARAGLDPGFADGAGDASAAASAPSDDAGAGGGAPAAATAPADPEAAARAGQLAQLRGALRACLDEIGVLGNLRRVEPEGRWHASLPDFEQRLLCALDHCAALGEQSAVLPRFDVLAELLGYTSEHTTIDFTRDFARAFVLGCVRSPGATPAAIVALLRSPEATREHQLDALALGSSPALDEAALRLLGAPAVELQRLGLELGTRRGTLRFEAVAPLLGHRDGGLRRGCCAALALLPESEQATEALQGALRSETDDLALAAVLRSLLVHDPAAALDALRVRLSDELAHPGALTAAARHELVALLGIAGAKRDAALIERLVTTDAHELEALGWYGSAEHIGRLLAELGRRAPVASHVRVHAVGDADDDAPTDGGPSNADPTRLAAARALHRITGAVLPATGWHADPYRPTTDPDRWRAWLGAPEHALETGVRLRFGAPYRCHATLDELAALDVPGAARELAAFELAVVTGQRPLDVRTWVARQRAELAVWRSALDQACGPAPGAAGSFPRRAALGPGGWLGDCFRKR